MPNSLDVFWEGPYALLPILVLASLFLGSIGNGLTVLVECVLVCSHYLLHHCKY